MSIQSPSFRRRATELAALLGWTVDFASDGAAWFFDSTGRDVAQSTTDAHLDALERDEGDG